MRAMKSDLVKYRIRLSRRNLTTASTAGDEKHGVHASIRCVFNYHDGLLGIDCTTNTVMEAAALGATTPLPSSIQHCPPHTITAIDSSNSQPE